MKSLINKSKRIKLLKFKLLSSVSCIFVTSKERMRYISIVYRNGYKSFGITGNGRDKK